MQAKYNTLNSMKKHTAFMFFEETRADRASGDRSVAYNIGEKRHFVLLPGFPA